MQNDEIAAALEQQRNDTYSRLRSQTLSERFSAEYKSLKDGSTAYLDGNLTEVLTELKKLSSDTSHNKSFDETAEAVNHLNDEEIITGFYDDVVALTNVVKSNGSEDQLQAIFIEYDYYYQYTGDAIGYGTQQYPLIMEPTYLSPDLYTENPLFRLPEAIHFEKAWPDCEAFEWTTSHLDVYYDLLRLYQLHSRLLLHQALRKALTDGVLDFLTVRPFSFYINEHDCEVMSLFRIE